MSRTAKYIKDIVIQDPDTGGDVEVTLFKHECGGIFGIDASWIDQVAEEDVHGDPMCNDPLADLDETDRLVLTWPKMKPDAILIPVKQKYA